MIENAAGDPQKPPKYRTSCDACNQAKVKCLQTRAACARCIQKKITCVYGISQRAGKHSASVSNRKPTTSISSGDVAGKQNPQSENDIPMSIIFNPDAISQASELSNYQQGSRNALIDEMRGLISPVDDNQDFLLSEFTEAASQSQSLQSSLFCLPGDGSYSPEVPTPASISTSGGFSSNRPGADDWWRSPGTRSDRMAKCACSVAVIKSSSTLSTILDTYDRAVATEASLPEFQSALKLCASSLVCPCAGHDQSSVLGLAMLITQILELLERQLAPEETGLGGSEDLGELQLNDNHHGTSMSQPEHAVSGRNKNQNVRSCEPGPDVSGNEVNPSQPFFSLGRFVVDADDDRHLKQEIWRLQVRKADILVGGFRNMVCARARNARDPLQAAAWEKLVLLIEGNLARVRGLGGARRSE